jgi:hypothetical protein
MGSHLTPLAMFCLAMHLSVDREFYIPKQRSVTIGSHRYQVPTNYRRLRAEIMRAPHSF